MYVNHVRYDNYDNCTVTRCEKHIKTIFTLNVAHFSVTHHASMTLSYTKCIYIKRHRDKKKYKYVKTTLQMLAIFIRDLSLLNILLYFIVIYKFIIILWLLGEMTGGGGGGIVQGNMQ